MQKEILSETIIKIIKDVLGEFKIINEKEGYSNKVFVLKSKSKKYILKISKETQIHPKPYGLYNEFIILRFLDSKNVDFVPKPIIYNKSPEFSIQTFVGEKEANISHFSKEKVNCLSDLIYNIAIFGDEFEEYLRKVGLNIGEPLNFKEVFEIYGIKRFIDIKEKIPHNIKSILEKEMKEISKNADWVSKVMGYKHLEHGDLSKGNIRISKEKIYLVDWELARVENFINPTFAFFLLWTNKEQREAWMFNFYKFMSKIGKRLDEVLDASIIVAKQQLFNDIVWAFKQALVLKEHNKNWKEVWNIGIRRFRYYKKRIREFEEISKLAYRAGAGI